MQKVSDFLGRYMTVLILMSALLALLFPQALIWLPLSVISPLLMLVMFGMGLTLKGSDFKAIFKRPKDVLIGCIVQFSVMPILAYALCILFDLDDALTAGVVLVGTCPGGTASNVMTYLAKGDVALSVAITSVNTLLAPVVTPLLTYLFLQTRVPVEPVSLFLAIITIVIVPIVLGVLLQRLIPKIVQNVSVGLPAVSVVSIAIIVVCVMAHNAQKVFQTGVTIIIVVVLHNLLGYAIGFLLARLLALSHEKSVTLSIEVGMQNSGLASALASATFPFLALATVPGALFSVWHNLSGALLASFFRKYLLNKDM